MVTKLQFGKLKIYFSNKFAFKWLKDHNLNKLKNKLGRNWLI